MAQSQSRGTNMPRVADFHEEVILDAIRRAPGGLSRVELTEETGPVLDDRFSHRPATLRVGSRPGSRGR